MTNKTISGEQAHAARDFEMMVAEEELILHAQILIKRAMREQKISQKVLAERLGVGPSYVSQMLGDSARNLTLRTIARVMHVLEQRATLIVDEYDLEAGATCESTSAPQATTLASLLSAPRPSSVWGNVISLPPREGKTRRTGEAKAFTDFEANEQEVAVAA
ncbi:MAG: hypothetical protein DI591_11060 [Citromicrobium sp.]|nr:MAG: hypothetical protein DI591_11060 [Citromicrobium sp.]